MKTVDRSCIAILLAFAAPTAIAASPLGLLIDDFEDGDLEADPGLSWVVFGDELLGGESGGRLEIEAGNATGGGKTLRFAGQAVETSRPPYVGVWTAARPDGLGADLSAYGALRFRARGTPGIYLGGLRTTSQFNFMAPFTLGREWTAVELPFTALAPQMGSQTTEVPAFTPQSVGWLGVVAGPEVRGAFDLELDDIVLVENGTQAPTRKTVLRDGRDLAGLVWQPLQEDPAGDGAAERLPDALAFHWALGPDGLVWFRFDLATAPPASHLGINLALEVDGDPANGMAWWGANKAFHFDHLVTAYLVRGDGYWQGWLGVAGAEAATRGVFDEGRYELAVAVDRAAPAFLLGVPREALPAGPCRLLGAVGSAFMFNDDVPSEGAAVLGLPAGS